MLISGILSIIQVLFLPGFLLLFLLNMHRGIIRCILLSCALSLVINFFLVYVLTVLHLYTHFIVYMIFAVELAILFLFRNIHQQPYEFFPENEYSFSNANLKECLDNVSIIHVIVFFLVVCAFVTFVRSFVFYSSYVFNYHDSVLNFNRWAVSWFNGNLPNQTWDYPQLLSTNWSLTYQFIFTDVVQMFASAITALFPLYSLLLLVDLGLRFKKLAYFVAVIVLGYFLEKGNVSLIEADILSGFLGMLSFYLLILAKNNVDLKAINRLIYLGAVIAAGSALTKQAGLFIAVLYPLFVYLLVIKQNPSIQISKKTVFYCALIILLLILPWYLYVGIQIFLGKESASYTSMLRPFLDNSFSARILLVFHELVIPSFGKIFAFVIIPVGFVVGMFASKMFRRIGLFFVIPYFIVWMFFFPYGIRNLNPVYPFIAVIVGFGICLLLVACEKCLQYKTTVNKFRAELIILIFFIITFVGYYNYRYNDTYLVKQQTVLRTQIFYSGLNKFLYSELEKSGYSKIIVTNLNYTDYLPVINKNFVRIDFLSKDLYIKKINQLRPDYLVIDKIELLSDLAVKQHVGIVRALFLHQMKQLKVRQYIDNAILSPYKNNYKVILDRPNYIVVKIGVKK